MAKFDFMVFDDDSFVVHASKYTKEQALELFNSEEGSYYYKKMLEAGKCRAATIDDVEKSWCKWVAKAPFGHDFEGGCYLARTGGRGSFPIWIIDVWRLRNKSS